MPHDMTGRVSARRSPRRSVSMRRIAAALAVTFGIASLQPAHSEDLLQVYREALQQDPTLKQADFQVQASRAGVARSRAVLLPQLNGSVSYDNDHGAESADAVIAGTPAPQHLQEYADTGARSRTDSVTLSQVVFNLADISAVRASRSTAAADDASLQAAQQNLIMRVVTAYFTILTDADQLGFQEANAAALKKLRDQAQAQLKAGITSKVDVEDFEASYDSATSAVIAARNQLHNDRLALEQIVGRRLGELSPIHADVPLDTPEPDSVDAWVQLAIANNPTLRAQHDATEAAGHEVTAARAAHLPTIAASLSYSRMPAWGPNQFNAGIESIDGVSSELGNVLSGHSRLTNTAVGVVLTVPLFSGGGAHAGVVQAIAERNKANQALVATRRDVQSAVQNALSTVKADIASVQSDQKAVTSAQAALKSTIAGHQVGTQGAIDVVIAQQNYLAARSAYAAVRSDLIVQRFALAYAAGTLTGKSIQEANALLQ